MRRDVIILGVILFVLISSGCIKETQKPVACAPEAKICLEKWYGRTDEIIDPDSGWAEDCSPQLSEVQEENPNLVCKLISEECFDEEKCVKMGATEISMVGCCRCNIECYGD